MLYQLLCLARPMASADLSAMIQSIGRVVYSSGGVVCDVTSYGRQYLAYKIKGVHGKYDQVREQLRRAAARRLAPCKQPLGLRRAWLCLCHCCGPCGSCP